MKKILITSIIFWVGYTMCYFTKSEESYNKGFEAGKNYVPPVMQRIDSLTIPEFTAKERRIISQFMLIIKKNAEVKE